MKHVPRDNQMLLRILGLVVLDTIIINCMNFLALLLRFDRYSDIPEIFLNQMFECAIPETIIILLIFALLKVYVSLWKFASIKEALNIVIAVLLGKGVCTLAELLAGKRMPISYYIFSTALLILTEVVSRFAYRAIRSWRFRREEPVEKQKKQVMLIGAGEAGSVILREMQSGGRIWGEIKCIIDDDIHKIGRYVSGVKVVGGRNQILEAVKLYGITDIIIAIPSMAHRERQEIINICNQTDCDLRILPAIYQLINGEVSASSLRPVEIEDLLAREPVCIQSEEVSGYVKNKVVLVTGGGGSIGSELCRQIAENEPKQLIILDIYENNAYDIQNELKETHPQLNLIVLIGSVRNTKRMEYIFSTYHPEIVYHAAAHKHVPLMEDSPNEAVKNNVLGTLKTAEMADRYGTKRFVLISTDKAVNPTNIMGASKRICEMIVQQYNAHSKTSFVAVRFGNVLGSNGSVIPLFKKQIAHGGPITVTHPDIIRYFMTIPEAVSLVLQAGANAKGGEIFVLDMGEPVKILDLALNLIRLSGLTPYEDIDIQFTGLRPGEKLYEELLMAEEGLEETANRKIKIGKPIAVEEEPFWSTLELLEQAAVEEKPVHSLIKRLVPEYVCSEEKMEQPITLVEEETESRHRAVEQARFWAEAAATKEK